MNLQDVLGMIAMLCAFAALVNTVRRVSRMQKEASSENDKSK